MGFNGTSLRNARVKAGLTQQGLADAAGVRCKSSISQYENGERVPRADFMQSMAEVLNVPVAVFFRTLTPLEQIVEGCEALVAAGTVDGWLIAERLGVKRAQMLAALDQAGARHLLEAIR